jgi:hypothetical protein
MTNIAGKEYFSTLDDLADQSKDIQRLLNFERFGLLDEDTQAAVDSERKEGRIPDPMQPITQEEFDNLKMIYGALTALSPNQTRATDMDYAKLHFSVEKAGNFFTDKNVQKEIGAILGGIVLPTFLPVYGQATLPARIAAFVKKYPRYAKTIAAFMGGTGGSAPFSDSYKEALGYGLREAAGEGAFQLIGKYFPYLRKIFRGKEGENIEDASRIALQIAESGGTTVTPGRLSTSRTIDMLEQIANLSIFGGGRMQKQAHKSVETIQNEMGKFLAKEFSEGTGDNVTANMVSLFMKRASQENVDDLMKNFLLKGQDFYDEAVEGAYKNVAKEISKLVGRNAKVIDISGLKKVLENQKKTLFGKGVGGKAVDPNDPNIKALENYLKQFEGGNGKVDIETANNMRSYFLSETGIFKTGIAGSPKFKAIAGALMDATQTSIDDSMKALAKTLNKEGTGKKYTKKELDKIMKLYAEANGLYKKGADTFNMDFITGLLVGESKGFTKKGLDMTNAIAKNFIAAGKPARVEAFFGLLKQGVDNNLITREAAELMTQKIQGSFITDVLSTNVDAVTGAVNAKAVLGALDGFRGKGKDIMGPLFTNNTLSKNPKAILNFRKYLRGLAKAQEKGIDTGAGTLYLTAGQFTSLGVFMGFTGGIEGAGLGDVAAGTLILGGPALIARAFTNPKFVHNLMNLKFATSAGDGKAKGLIARSFLNLLEIGVSDGIFSGGNAKSVATNAVVEGILKDEDLKGLEFMLTPPETLPNLEDNKKKNNTDALINSINEETSSENLIDINIDDASMLPSIEIPESSSDIMANVIDSPVTLDASAPTTQSTPGPVGSSINPETQQKLESVGMPLFANQGGIASLMTQRKKPKQMVV